MANTTIFYNKRLAYDYDILDKLEVGIRLFGWEVKSLKNAQVNLNSAFIEYVNGELRLKGAQISPWRSAPFVDKQGQMRDRILLAHKAQMAKIGGMASRPGYTMAPLEIFVNDKGLLKMVVALVKGKKKYEKKQKIKDRDMQRQIDQDMRRMRY